MAPQWLLKLSHHLHVPSRVKDIPEASWKSHRALLLTSHDLELSHMVTPSCKEGSSEDLHPGKRRWGHSLACLKREAQLSVAVLSPSKGLCLPLPPPTGAS